MNKNNWEHPHTIELRRAEEMIKSLRQDCMEKQAHISTLNRNLEMQSKLLRQDTLEIECLNKKLDAAEAQIDALMLEFCPDEMTLEQVERWEDNQRVVD